MEDQGQYYAQCVTEVNKCKILGIDIQDSVGPVAVITFNDDPLGKIMNRMNTVRNTLKGKVESSLLIKN